MLNQKVVFSKERIFERVWGIDSDSQLDTVTESIKNIRKKSRPSIQKPLIFKHYMGSAINGM